MNDLRWKLSTAPTMNWTDCELGATMAGVGFRSRSSRGCSHAACRRFLADRARCRPRAFFRIVRRSRQTCARIRLRFSVQLTACLANFVQERLRHATRALLPTIACWRLRALSVQRAGQRARCCCFGAARTNRPRLRRRRHRRQNAGCIAVSHLDRRLERRTGSCKTVAHGFAEARSALEPDEGQAGKVGRGDDWLFGERMLMRQHADHLAGVNHFMGDARGDASGRARSRARRRGSARLR